MHFIRRMLSIQCKADARLALPLGRFGLLKRNFFYQKVLRGARISLEKPPPAHFTADYTTFGTAPEPLPAILTGVQPRLAPAPVAVGNSPNGKYAVQRNRDCFAIQLAHDHWNPHARYAEHCFS